MNIYFKLLIGVIIIICRPLMVLAQIEKVMVETYYVSDVNDATDTIGGSLPAGSKTYRIYIDLLPGYKLKKVYGDINHPFKIASSTTFFNNKSDGQSFGKDFSKNRYRENTVALDTWLTLGQTTRASAGAANFGIPKKDDDNGSFIGGINNDGGSSAVLSGLLINNDSAAGIPLTVADGMDTLQSLPGNWLDYGIRDEITGNDSTIFGSIKSDSVFISNDIGLQNSGSTGVLADSNQILIAQLTTSGEISFEINIEVLEPNGNTKKYVADGNVLLPDEIVNPNLKYPAVCGCMDPNFLEYSANYACGNQNDCRTLIVIGCTDPLACNYNPRANISTPSLCCYPGSCNDLDISLVCPTLLIDETEIENMVTLFPNPAIDYLTIEVSSEKFNPVYLKLSDCLGRNIMQQPFDYGKKTELNIDQLTPGVYYLHLSDGNNSITRIIAKK